MCSNFFLHKQNVSIFSKIFGTKPKLFDVFQLLFSKSKTLLYNPKKIRAERELFGSITNFVSKTNMLVFWGTLVGKRKQTILKKRWFDMTKTQCHSQVIIKVCLRLKFFHSAEQNLYFRKEELDIRKHRKHQVDSDLTLIIFPT